MKRLAIIPARSGSKGLKDKNIKDFCGKPLIYYSIRAALESQMFDKVFVSTDSPYYAKIAESFGADASFLRSKEMASDTASTWDVVREVLAEFDKRGNNYDQIMVLQATSPLRTSKDIIEAVSLFNEKNANAVVSLAEVDHSPLWCNTLPPDHSMENFNNSRYANLPRQKLPTFYRYNGAIYLINRKELNEPQMFRHHSFAYIMPKERSIDIDSEMDFRIGELFMKNKDSI